MSVDSDVQETYYHSNKSLNGWIIQGMYPDVPSLSPLIGKRFTSETQQSTPVTETTSIPTKRKSSHLYPFSRENQPVLNLQTEKRLTSKNLSSTLTTEVNLESSNYTKIRRTLSPTMEINNTVINKPENSNLYDQLSNEQKRIHDCIVNDKENVFFTGSAGTGKSVLLKAIISTLKSIYPEEEIAITASTGIAALNIGGITIHSFAHVKLGDEHVDTYIKNIKKSELKKRIWKRVKILIIDEISMIDGALLDKLEEIARRIRGSNQPFGGIQLIFSGDFFQLPPVNRHQITVLAFEAKCWKRIINKNMVLTTCFRQKDQKFIRILNELRIGKISQETERIFHSLSRPPKVNIDIIPTELYPIRAKVDAANNGRLKLLDGESYMFLSTDQGNKTVLNRCVAPEELILKIGAQVMLIKNLTSTLVNGSIGIVIGFTTAKGSKRYPVVKFTNGTEKVIYEETWDYHLPGLPLISRKQIPLVLAWAISIHKAQGQTIEYVKVDLEKAFEEGQVYVALSRATCLDNLQILNFKKSLVKVNEKVIQFYNKISNNA